jgi:hypothetical protein
MNKNFFAFVLIASASFIPSAHADVVQVPPDASAAPATAPAALPQKGQAMDAVAKQFGEPRMKYPAVGGGSAKQPPITRWDYDGFSVFFENSHVVDAVVPGNPPEIHHTDQLQPQPAPAQNPQ